MPEYKLPDVGEGLTEAEIVSWHVKVGDEVKINDIVVEIETAKSIVELPSPYAGTVTALLVPEGETIPVGTPIIAIGAAGEAPAGAGGEPGAAAGGAAPRPTRELDLANTAAAGGGEGESLVGRNKADRGPVRRARRASAGAAAANAQTQGAFDPGASPDVVTEPDDASDDAAVEDAVPATPAEPAAGRDEDAGAVRVLAKPPVRKLAKDLGVDLTTLTPTGPDGTVSRDDVQQAAAGATAGAGGAAPAASVARGVPAGERETREPIKGVRKMMAQAMSRSAFTAPHVTEWITVDVTRTMELVERLRGRRELRDLKVSPLLVLARACMLAMKRTPEINSTWDDAAQEVVYKHYVNLGIAAATPRGLVVPNVKDADRLSLVELAAELGTLVDTARAGKTQPAEMSGGTFTITNVGVFGVDAGTPIINPGESAILAFGAIRKQPWVVTGADGSDELAIRQITTLALSFDHRHIDGEKGSRFIADVAGILEDPATALLY